MDRGFRKATDVTKCARSIAATVAAPQTTTSPACTTDDCVARRRTAFVVVWYGMVNVDLYSAIVTKVSNALNTLVSGEKPGFQAVSKELIVLLCAEVVRQGVPDHGPCTANARRPTVDSRCRGTTISCCVADLRRCLPTTSVTGVQQSTRYCGALPCRHLCMMTPSLYVT